MRVSSRTKLKQLSPAQKSLLEGHRKRWKGIRLSTAPANRDLAEEGIAAAYRAAGYSPPKQIVWCSSPIEMAGLWSSSPIERSGQNLKGVIVDQVRSRVAAAIQRQVCGSVLASADDAGIRAVSNTATETAMEAVIRASHVIRPEPPTRLRWFFLLRTVRPKLSLEDAGCCPRSFFWLDRHEYFRNACGLEDETEPVLGLISIAENADWIVPHKHICWISEPPGIFETDEKGRLHSPSGPALRYRDGWCAYAWKGVLVPSRIIDFPGQITCSDIDRATDIHVRRCMIERLTPEKYISFGAAYRVSEDETGILWERRWSDGDAWAVVEVVNGTPEPDGTRRRYFLQVPPNMLTARSAVAWTYGMTGRQYRGLVLRT